MIARVVVAIAISALAAPLSQAASHGIVSAKEYHFRGTPDGSQPDGALLSDGAGNFYGTTSSGGLKSCGLSTPLCGTVFKVSVGTNGTLTETVLYKFQGVTDGAAPAGSLIFDSAGNLYGTTDTRAAILKSATDKVAAPYSSFPPTRTAPGAKPSSTASSAAPTWHSRRSAS